MVPGPDSAVSGRSRAKNEKTDPKKLQKSNFGPPGGEIWVSGAPVKTAGTKKHGESSRGSPGAQIRDFRAFPGQGGRKNFV